MAGTPAVSVIIPAFNQGRYLAAAIQSVLDQSLTCVEIVVVDDGSTDETGAVALSFGNKVQYVFQRNSGHAAARNRGFRASSGAYIQYLDSDDLIEPEKLKYHAEFLDTHPDVDIVYGDVRYFTPEEPAARWLGPYALEGDRAFVPTLWHQPGSVLSKLVRGNMLAINCALLRRSVVEVVGPWNERLTAVADWEYWIRCAAAGQAFRFVDSPRTLALVRWHSASLTHDKRRSENAQFKMRLAVARVVDDPGFRRVNCAFGIDAARRLGSEGRFGRLLRMALKTSCPCAWLALLDDVLTRDLPSRVVPDVVRRATARRFTHHLDQCRNSIVS